MSQDQAAPAQTVTTPAAHVESPILSILPDSPSIHRAGRAQANQDFAAMLKEMAADTLASGEPAAQPLASSPPAGTVATEPTTAPIAAPAAAAPVAAPEAFPGLDKLVAKEVAIAQERAALDAQRKQIEADRRSIEELRAGSKHLDPEIARLAKTNPREALQRLGVDPELAIQMAMAEKLGPDKVPAELKQNIENAKMREEINTLRAQLANREALESQNRIVSETKQAVSQYVSSGISQDVPTVRAVAAANPTMVHDAIFNEIATDAAARYAAEPNGEPISYEEAAKRVEAKWSVFSQALAPKSAPAATTAAPAAAPTPAAQPAAAKPAPVAIHKPLYYGQNTDRASQTSAAVAEALAEFRRATNAQNNG